MTLFSGIFSWGRIPADARRVILLARVRSGTTVFGSLLDTHPDIVTFGEIFNEENKDSYFHFLQSRIRWGRTQLFPSRSGQNFSDYMTHLQRVGARRKPNARVCLANLKYSQSRHLVKRGHMIMDPPYVFECLRQEDIDVIHLIRRNHLRTVLSNHMMKLRVETYPDFKGHYNFLAANRKTKRYLNEVPGKVRLGRGGNLRRELTNFYRRMDEENECVRTAFADREGYLELYYEDLFERRGETQVFAPTVIEKTQRFLRVEDQFDVKPRVLKATPQPLSELMENYDEVARALEDTPYAWFLEDKQTD